jgi:MFS family permease
VLLSGYFALGAVYVLLAFGTSFGLPALGACLALYGFYYAATEGVLTAMASAAVPPDIRASGLAALTTAVGVGKMFSSLLFGWVWERYGILVSIEVFAVALSLSTAIAVFLLGRSNLPAASVAP